MATDADNLKIQQQINAVLAERSRILDAQASRIADQVELAMQLCKALKCEEVDKTTERIEQLRSSLQSAAKDAGTAGGSISSAMQDAAAAIAAAAAEAEKLRKKEIAGVEKSLKSLGKFGQGVFGHMVNSVKALGNGILDAAQFVSSLALSIINIPIKIFDVLLDKAAELAGNTAIFDAMENVREQFGDIGKGFGKQVVDGGASIRSSLKDAGLSAAKVFGTGPEGIARSIDASREMAMALGDAVEILGEDFDKVAGPLFVLQKGLGLTEENMKGLVIASRLAGRSATDMLKDIQKLSKDMSEKFGMSSKVVARDMAYMLQNTAKYGKLSAAQVAATVVYVKKLGLEVKQIEGLVTAFDDFETAATNASKLAQAFGMNVDAMRMMKEQDPGKRLEMLRVSFAATGKSIDMMTRQEKQLLAQTAGLDEAIVEQALSAKNAGKSYRELSKEAEITAKKQKTQQEMFEDLGNNIKRVVEALDYSGGLLSNFFKGFGEGLARSQNGRKVLYDIVGLLKQVRQLGRLVGDAFAQAFPGVKEMLENLGPLVKTGIKVDDLAAAFKSFFAVLQSDPAKAVSEFIDTFSRGIDNATSLTGPGGAFLQGLKTFSSTVIKIFAGIVDNLGPRIASAIDTLAKVIGDPDGIEAGFKKLAGEGETMFSPLYNAIIRQAPQLWESLKGLITATWDKYGDDITKFLGLYLGANLGIGIMKYAIIGMFAALPGMIASSMGGGAGEGLLTVIAKKIVNKGLSRAAAGIGGKALGATGIGLAIAAAISASDIDKITGDTLQKKLDNNEIKYSGSIAGGKIAATIVNALTLGFLSDETYTNIAVAMASLQDGIFSLIEKYLGTGIAENISQQFTANFRMLSGVGDIIFGLITLDLSKLLNGIRGFMFGLTQKLLNLVMAIPVFIANLYAKYWATVIEYGLKAFASISKFSKNLTDSITFDGVKSAIFSILEKKIKEPFVQWMKGFKDFALSFAKQVASPLVTLREGFQRGLKAFEDNGTNNEGITNAVISQVIPDPGTVKKSLELSGEAIKGATIENLNSLGDEIAPYIKMTPAQIDKTTKRLNEGIVNMQKIIAGINNEGLVKMRESMTVMDTGAITMFRDFTGQIEELADLSSVVEGYMIKAMNSYVAMSNIIGAAAATADGTDRFVSEYRSGMVTYVEKVITELRELDTLLDDITISSLDGTIDSLNSKLLVNNKQIKIENKPINIKLNIGISFKAEDFTKNIFAVAGKLVKDGNTTLQDFTNTTYKEYEKEHKLD